MSSSHTADNEGTTHTAGRIEHYSINSFSAREAYKLFDHEAHPCSLRDQLHMLLCQCTWTAELLLVEKRTYMFTGDLCRACRHRDASWCLSYYIRKTCCPGMSRYSSDLVKRFALFAWHGRMYSHYSDRANMMIFVAVPRVGYGQRSWPGESFIVIRYDHQVIDLC